jgi:DUF35 OB-fold domain, acyl-CoA-associated
LNWIEPSGQGTVYSTTVVRRKPEAGGDYNVALIDLAEGVRLMSRVDDVAPDQVRIGMPVRAQVIQKKRSRFGDLHACRGKEMSLKDFRGTVAVAGVGQAGFDQATGFTEMEILEQAAQRAVADAGLTMQDIDGICTASVAAIMWAMPVIEHLGILKSTMYQRTRDKISAPHPSAPLRRASFQRICGSKAPHSIITGV